MNNGIAPPPSTVNLHGCFEIMFVQQGYNVRPVIPFMSARAFLCFDFTPT